MNREGVEERKNIGALIRRIRRSSGMSQAKLAERLGISYQQVQKYENGKSELTLTRLRQVAHALGVPLSTLMEISDLSREDTEVLSLFRAIKDDALRGAAVRLIGVIAEAAPARPGR